MKSLKALLQNRDSALLAGALLLLLAALFQPTVPLKRDLHNYLLVADVTQSMNTADMKLDGKAVSRLAYTRHLMREAVAELPCGTQVSLGIFSAENIALLYTPIEVCANYDVIQDSIAHLEWRMAWRGNSRLRFGIKSATAVLSSLPVPAQLVMFTDGDEAPKLNAINKLDLSGWQGGKGWLIVGVGGDEPFPIPKFDSEDHILGYWAMTNMILAPSQVQSEESLGTRDDTIASDDYNRYMSQLDEPYLKELAAEISARYLRASKPEALLKAMQQQAPAGHDITRFPIDWLLISGAIALMLIGYWPNLAARFRPQRRHKTNFVN
ncbi:MAG TPA: VWA domain-containing protein [Methylophilaceae bacterium]|nr:VWA domain-containing protein [Methylophilaceae bacterium]